MTVSKQITVDEAINIMVDRIVERFKPEKIILFGSQACGTATSDSDIDLLVVFHNCADRKMATISILKALADLPVGKDIVVTTSDELETRGKLESTILYPALQEGKLIYAA